MDIKIEPQGTFIKITSQFSPDLPATSVVWHSPKVALDYITLMARQGINLIIESNSEPKQARLL